MKKWLRKAVAGFAAAVVFGSAGVLPENGFKTLSTIASAATVVESGTCGDELTWTLDNEGTFKIESKHGWFCPMYDIDGAPWKSSLLKIKKVIIGHGIYSVNYFEGCTNLKSVEFELSDNERENCDSITIGSEAFEDCTSLTSVDLPKNVTQIGYSAFEDCTSLTDINLPEGLTVIGSFAFSGCNSLISINIPSSVSLSPEPEMNIDSYNSENAGLTKCERLREINVDPSNENYCSENGVLYNKDRTELLCYPCGKTEKKYVLPSSVTNIGPVAFSYNKSLTNIELPDSLESIEHSAFSLTNITSISIPKNVYSICDNVFVGCLKLNQINVDPDNEYYFADNGVLFGKERAEIIYYPPNKTEENYIIPNDVICIANKAFYSTKLTKVTIPDGLNSIGDEAFFSANLQKIIIPKSVTSIGYWAFNYCSSLKNIYFTGTEAQWSKISNLSTACIPSNCTIHYNYDPTAIAVKSLTVTTPSPLPKFYTGDDFDPTGYKLNVTYDDNSKETIDLTLDMISGYDKTKSGAQTLTVSYGGKTATFRVTVTALTVNKIEIGTNPKTDYFLGDELDLTGGTLIVTYNSGKTETIAMTADGVTNKGFDSAKTGVKTITFTYGAKTTTLKVNVTIDPDNPPARTVTALTVTAPKPLPKFFTGDDFDPTGYTLKVTYDDRSTEVIDITDDMISGNKTNMQGNERLTVTYGGKTAALNVTVTKLMATKVEIGDMPKTTYYLTDNIDLFAGTLIVTYNSGKTETVSMTDDRVTVKGFDSTKTGVKKVSLTLLGKIVNINMEVAVDPNNAPVLIGDKGYENLDSAVKAINADIKAKTAKDSYTIKLWGNFTETKAVTFPKVGIVLEVDSASTLTIPSVTANGDLTMSDLTVVTAKGAPAPVTAKMAFTATDCVLGKTTVTGHADINSCTINGDLTLNEKDTKDAVTATEMSDVTVNGKLSCANALTLTDCTVTGLLTAKASLTIYRGQFFSITVSAREGTTTLSGIVTITKDLNVSNDLIIDGDSTVGGKFTAKGKLSINGFTVKNGK